MVRCNMCMEIYSYLDILECPECKTDAYLMDCDVNHIKNA